jgi:nucleotide-binding universal stress UspA family protein
MKHILAEGQITREIVSTARKENTDFIVIGTKGAGWLKQIFMGTVAAEVMENACCPVLAVPEKAVFDGTINKIGVTTSFDLDEVEVLKKALEFAKIFNAKVHCLHVNTSKKDTTRLVVGQFKKHFEGIENLSFTILEGSSIQKTLSSYVESKHFDVLAMLSHKRRFMEELMTYNDAKMMAYRSKTPILAFHPK